MSVPQHFMAFQENLLKAALKRNVEGSHELKQKTIVSWAAVESDIKQRHYTTFRYGHLTRQTKTIILN